MTHSIIDALLRHIRSGIYPMHVPAHKQGRGSNTVSAAVIAQYLYKMDLTEVPGLDDLSEPSGCIQDTEAAAAALFSADRSFLLVNGATVGVEAAILAACPPGTRIAISGVVHKSAIAGIALAGAEPVLLYTRLSSKYLMPLGVDPAEVERCLAEEKGIRAVLVTNPSYYGVCQDLEAIASICHKHGAILIVDEAHGGHLSFSSELPISGLHAGADIVIQSAHKTLGSLTQTALMHVKGQRVDHDRLASCLRLLQTTSPSYILMASLDSVIHRLSLEGESLVASAVANAREMRRVIRGLSGVSLLSPEDLEPVFSLDPTRITVSAADRGILGTELQERLRSRGYQVEFSDLLSTVAVTSYADDDDDLRGFCSAIEDAIADAPSRSSIGEKLRSRVYPLMVRAAEEQATSALSIRAAVLSHRREVLLEDSIGEVSADGVYPYPPGVPLLLPGQVITESVVDLIKELLAVGISIRGIKMREGSPVCSIVD